jgi:hypothetical protein
VCIYSTCQIKKMKVTVDDVVVVVLYAGDDVVVGDVSYLHHR